MGNNPDPQMLSEYSKYEFVAFGSRRIRIIGSVSEIEVHLACFRPLIAVVLALATRIAVGHLGFGRKLVKRHLRDRHLPIKPHGKLADIIELERQPQAVPRIEKSRRCMHDDPQPSE